MSDELTQEQIDGAVMLIKSTARTAMLVPVETAVELVNQHNREETLLPLLDPTRYMQTAHLTRWHEPLLRAFLQFRRELEKLKDEHL